MKLERCVFAALLLCVIASNAFAQTWGDVAAGQSLIDWILGPVIILVITIALFGAIAIGLWQQSIMAGIGAFAGICVIGGVASFIPDIAQAIAGG
jgi:hypothetical protein